MNPTRLAHLVLVIGAAAILGSLAFALPAGPPETAEVVAQFMLLGVLWAAVRYGRRGGTIAACTAAVAYVAMRLPQLAAADITPELMLMVASRIAAFGLVGIVGGEASRRLMYSFVSVDGGSALDEWSGVFNESFLRKELDQALGRFTRYGEPFTMVLITLSPSLLTDLKPSRQRAIVRRLSDNLRSDIRMVDEVARLDDGRFVVLLPHTPKSGGQIVCSRLLALSRSTLAARDEAVTARSMSCPDDESAMRALQSELAARSDDQSEIGA